MLLIFSFFETDENSRLKENPKGSKAFDANNDSGYKNAVKMTLLQKIFHEKIKKKLKIWVLIKKIDY